MDWLTLFLTLCFLEIILGIDNVLSFSMLVRGAPESERKQAKVIGLCGAFVARIICVAIALHLKHISYAVSAGSLKISFEQLFVCLGGLFLIFRSTQELYQHQHSLNEPVRHDCDLHEKSNVLRTIVQIIFIDLVFAIDSVLVAIAFTENVFIIIPSIALSMIFMYFSCDIVISYTEKSWRLNILGLFFVFLIGAYLVLQSMGLDCQKGYLISIIVFSSIYETYMYYLEQCKQKGQA